ncbi:MAG: ATP-dependent Clp protease ATP-binding subunit [Candidatus Harrisonbacteria bacterium]|nr:ATP-dependent Clp protease ATP-binding subunit [Candidatus Harrisonbacteria bacterium]
MAELYFEEKRIHMKASGRFFVRLLSYLSYGILLSVALVFFLSELQSLNAVAILIGLFLLDRVLHLTRPQKFLFKAPFFSKGRSGQPHRDINAAHYFLPRSIKLLELAHDRALLLGGELHMHLFLLLLKRSDIQRALIKMEIAPRQIQQKAEGLLKKSQSYQVPEKELDRQIRLLAIKAFRRAQELQKRSVEPSELMAALSEVESQGMSGLFSLFEIQEGDFRNALLFAGQKRKNSAAYLHRPKRIRHRVMNRAWTARPTPTLDRYSHDISDEIRAGAGRLLVGHEKEYNRLLDVLSKSSRRHALLLGEAGVGKETLVYHLGRQIVADQVPQNLFDKRIVALEIGGLLSVGEAKAKELAQHILDEIFRAKNVILFIPDIHLLLKGGDSSAQLADVFLPALEGEENFIVIGASYPSEYKQYVENSSAFRESFDLIRVEPMEQDEAVQLLVLESTGVEEAKDMVITFAAVKRAVELAQKYLRQKPLPQNAKDLLAEAISDILRKDKKVLEADDIIDTLQRSVNVPLHRASPEEKETLLHLEAEIHKSYINQEEAVSAVSDALREYRSGLASQRGPLASFLFIGPTGVGKTELSKIIARIQFSSTEAMLRFDMSEYQGAEALERLIGSNDGQRGGILTEAIRQKPYSLVLLDEFEKASPQLLNIFLQVLDEGRLSDGLGRTVSFKDSIIVATSNAHSGLIKEELEKGASLAFVKELLSKRLHEYFKPELLNRFSKIIVFKPLSRENLLKVAQLRMEEFGAHLEKERGIRIEVSESALEALTTLGHDPVYGARPLNRVIEERIRAELAKKILEGGLSRGDGVVIQYSEGHFRFSTEKI